jgi:hypothetical protein
MSDRRRISNALLDEQRLQWLFSLQRIAHGGMPTVLLGCGILCAAMPYGWYRALRELLPKNRALSGALIIGLVPESIGIYGYFMNETLLLTLMGFCFWFSLRCHRKRTVSAYAPACVFWLCAAFTRTVAIPMTVGCVFWLLTTQSRRVAGALVAIGLTLVLTVSAGLHACARLGFFAPMGNLYVNEIYFISGMHDIAIGFGPAGEYRFAAPSFYNPTFYPFSNWTTDRAGTAAITIDLSRGRAAWIAEKARVARQRTFPVWRQRWEDLQYLFFGQNWPNSDSGSIIGWLTLWTRWVWAPLAAVIAWAALTRGYRGPAWLLPICALGTLALLIFQSEGVMEARFRMPIDAILICAAMVMTSRTQPVTRTGV